MHLPAGDRGWEVGWGLAGEEARQENKAGCSLV